MKFGLCNCARVLLAIVCTAGTTVCSWGGQPLERLNLLEYVGNFDDDQDVAGDDERCPRNGYSYGIANGWGPMNGRYDKQVFEPQVRSDSPYRGRRYQRVAALRSPSETKVMELASGFQDDASRFPSKFARSRAPWVCAGKCGVIGRSNRVPRS